MPSSSASVQRDNNDADSVAYRLLLHSHDELNNRAPSPLPHSNDNLHVHHHNHHSHHGHHQYLGTSPGPSPGQRRQKKTGHRGEAGFGSSVINLANTILGMLTAPTHCMINMLTRSHRCRYTRYGYSLFCFWIVVFLNMLILLSSDAGGNVVNGCLDGSTDDHLRRLHLRNRSLFPFPLRPPHRTRPFIVFRSGKENIPRSSRRL
jgi:hypothetical protein